MVGRNLEGARPEGTGFSNSEGSTVPNLCPGLSQTGLVLFGGILKSISELTYKGWVNYMYISKGRKGLRQSKRLE